MRFLAKEIPDAPEGCPSRADCTLNVEAVHLLAATLSAVTQELLPTSPGQELAHGDEAALDRAGGIINALPAVFEQRKPAAQRCGACIINGAVNILKHGGDV